MSALGGIYAALKTACGTDGTVAALLASSPGAWAGVNGKAVYDDGAAPQPTQASPLSTLTPWLTVGAGTEVPFVTFRSRGWECTVQVKVTWQGPEATGQAIVRALSSLLVPASPLYLTVTGFTSSWVHELAPQQTLLSTIGGVVTRECPVILRVYAT